ncbi:hypothetical protein [Actinomadura sp. 21ATH]|uniref:hypothetical protein n=1 Tax=Actinomadura sp. 21ATH TaxID=1735444 RepID=UPI0035BF3397
MEDTLHEMPASWLEKVHPRRGGRYVPKVELDRSAPQRLADWIHRETQRVEEAIRRSARPDLVESARRYLNGEVDATGAAAVFHVLALPVCDPGSPAWVADALTCEHGLPFAASATARTGDLVLGDHRYVSEPEAFLRRMRTLLAVADDNDHAAAVEALALCMESYRAARQATYLAPTRHDWVEMCLDREIRSRLPVPRWEVMCSLGTPEHADLCATAPPPQPVDQHRRGRHHRRRSAVSNRCGRWGRSGSVSARSFPITAGTPFLERRFCAIKDPGRCGREQARPRRASVVGLLRPVSRPGYRHCRAPARTATVPGDH